MLDACHLVLIDRYLMLTASLAISDQLSAISLKAFLF